MLVVFVLRDIGIVDLDYPLLQTLLLVENCFEFLPRVHYYYHINMGNNQYGSFLFFTYGLQLSLFFYLSLNTFLNFIRFYNLRSILVLPLELPNRVFVKFRINAKLLQAEYVTIAPSSSLRLQLPLEISNSAGDVTLEGSLILIDKETQLRPLRLAGVSLLTAAAHSPKPISNQIDNPYEDLNANRKDDDDHNGKRYVKLGIVHSGKRD